MIELSTRQAREVAAKPETGMGYHVVTVVLTDGRQFKQAVIVEGRITHVRGRTDIPFHADEIAEIVVTHDKWNFNAER